MAGHTMAQLLRFAGVGLATNVAGYLLYLFLTAIGGTPKWTMSVLYVVGTVLGYLANRRITFPEGVAAPGSVARYAFVYGLGYAMNLGLLHLFVDRLGFAHQLVQAVAICVVAACLFVALKFLVFPARDVPVGDR